MLRRAFHDNLPDSRHNTVLQNNLESSIRFYLCNYVIPNLRMNNSMKLLKEQFRSDIIEPYNITSYSLGARYVKQLVNDNSPTLSTDVKDREILNSLNQKYNDQFWSLIDSYVNMQRSENRRGYQIVAGEKERLASELASTICWTSFNQGIKNKGLEYKDQIEKLGQNGELISGIVRDVRNKDFTMKKQLILTRRWTDEDREKLSARRKKGTRLPKKKGPPAKKGRPVKVKDIPGLERNLRGNEDFAKIVFILITQRDEKVCAECRDLELDSWESGDPDLPDPPVHPSCRCRLALAESEFLE
jgi:hypothetical protein